MKTFSSVEIEGVLHKHEAVSLAAVVALPDEKWGEVPCAFIELLDGAAVTEKEIEVFCRAHLAGFKPTQKGRFLENFRRQQPVKFKNMNYGLWHVAAD